MAAVNQNKSGTSYSHLDKLIETANARCDEHLKSEGKTQRSEHAFDKVLRELSLLMCLHNHRGAKLDHIQAAEFTRLAPSKVKAHANSVKDYAATALQLGAVGLQIGAHVMLGKTVGMAAETAAEKAAKAAAEAPGKLWQLAGGVADATGKVAGQFGSANQVGKKFESEDISRLGQHCREDANRKHDRASQNLAALEAAERARHDAMIR